MFVYTDHDISTPVYLHLLQVLFLRSICLQEALTKNQPTKNTSQTSKPVYFKWKSTCNMQVPQDWQGYHVYLKSLFYMQ